MTDPWAAARRLMVEDQLIRRGITSSPVLEAMGHVPRHEFVPAAARESAYDDCAMAIGLGQTISQPYMVALMCELLDVAPAHRVLEVGAGSGYQAAVLGQLAAEVVAMELVPELAERARAALARTGCVNAEVIAGDGTLGCPERAPFDRIIIAAAAPAVPGPLVEQLAEGGKLVAPVGERRTQTCTIYEKCGDGLRTTDSISCVFVPLRGRHGWPE
jgi:protein-L-isoaspartate(D-aspartate) O-methyltransferase